MACCKSFDAFMHDNSAAKVEVLGGLLRGLGCLSLSLGDGFFKPLVTIARHNDLICNIIGRTFVNLK